MRSTSGMAARIRLYSSFVSRAFTGDVMAWRNRFSGIPVMAAKTLRRGLRYGPPLAQRTSAGILY